jgi:hypothetical protein
MHTMTLRSNKPKRRLAAFGIKPLLAGIILVMLAAAIDSASSALQARTEVDAAATRSFDQYPAARMYHGPSKMPDFNGRDRQVRNYRTLLRNGIKEGVNFAGQYKIIQFGCGTFCSFVFVADVSTGRVYPFPYGGEDYPNLQMEYRPSSTLARVWWVPDLGQMDRCIEESFLMKNGGFTSLGKTDNSPCPPDFCENGQCGKTW